MRLAGRAKRIGAGAPQRQINARPLHINWSANEHAVALRQSTDLSLVISSLNEGQELRETLTSLFCGSVIPREIVVVDDGSNDDSCAPLEQDCWRAQGVTVYRTSRSGIANARNIGVRVTHGSQLVFLDAHCRLDLHCLRELTTGMIARPDAILAPAICDFGSTVYGCGARLIDAQLRVRWLEPAAHNGAFYAVPIAPGGCFALSRATFDRLGGLGSFRELGQEDVEFSLRAWRLGIDALAWPSAKLAHRFRPYPSYRLSSSSRGYNVARIALIHFDGARREECLRTIIGTPRAAEVLVDAIASDWEVQRSTIDAFSVRSIQAFFDHFGDWR